MVYKVVRHIHENRVEADLLMDVPARLSWGDLKELTANRHSWRKRVFSLLTVTVTINPSLPGCLSSPHRISRIQQLKTNKSAEPPSTKRYISRDTHEASFRPPGEKDKRKRGDRHHKSQKRRKSPALTDKQRAEWARAHYELHHGTNKDCIRVLCWLYVYE